MNPLLRQIQSEVLRVWSPLTRRQRMIVGGLSGGAVLFALFFVLWATAPSYNVLFSGLSSQDAASIVTQLQSSKTPYQLASGGTTIMVPASMVDAARLQMASQGLPQSGVVGFELFDKINPLTTNDYLQRLDYTRALEGELARTVMSISGIDFAKINIVIPDPNVFATQQNPATASVLVKFGLGGGLSAGQVAGIQHLVASAVSGLQVGDVTVVDASGNILSQAASASGAATAQAASSQEQGYDQSMQTSIAAMLDTILGPNRSVVRVHATMNWNAVDSTANTYSPRGAAAPQISAIHAITNSTGSGILAVGGAPLTSKLLPSYSAAVSGTNSGSLGQDVTENFSISQLVQHTIQTPGAVQSLSVAVVLDRVVTPTVLAAVRQAVAAAVGLQPARGDVLSVSSLAFDQSTMIAAQNALAAQQQQSLLLSIAKWASIILFPLIIFLLLRRTFTPTNTVDDAPEVIEARRILALAQQGQDYRLGSGDNGDQLLLHEPSAEEQRRSAIEETMMGLAQSKPEVVAQIIQGWLQED